MKILVTGANGFIGSNTTNRLLENDDFDIYEVIHKNLDEHNENVKNIIADLSDIDTLKKIVSVCGTLDAIIHIAACISKDNQEPKLVQTNCRGMQNIIKTAHELKCKRFIYMSSIPVIGKPVKLPITEEHPTNPETTYHATKLFGEHIAMLHENRVLNPIILRISSPVGAGMNSENILYTFLANCKTGQDIVIHGEGSRRQNYVDVRDIVTAVELALHSDMCGIYNIAGRQSVSNYELAKMCVGASNAGVSITHSGQVDPEEGDDWEISIEKAAQELRFAPKYSIMDTIKSLAGG